MEIAWKAKGDVCFVLFSGFSEISLGNSGILLELLNDRFLEFFGIPWDSLELFGNFFGIPWKFA
jgi:hypothetical protein